MLENMIEFIRWTVLDNKKVVVFLHNGEIIRGRSLAYSDNILQIIQEESISKINTVDISDIFSIKEN